MGRCDGVRRFRLLVGLTVGLAGLLAFPMGAAIAAGNLSSKPPRTMVLSAAVSRSAGKQNTRNQSRNDEYRLSRERYEKAVEFSRASYQMYFASVFLIIAALLIVLWSGMAAKYRDWAERVSDKRAIQALIFVPVLLLTADAVELPLRMYGHVLSVRYEMSVQGWGPWFVDWSKERLLMLGFGLILALGLMALIRKSPRRWWFWGWCAALPIAAFVVFISPWFIDPMFNRFAPLQASNPELVAAIEKLTAHAGVPIPPERMFLMKASEKTNAIDAYVTGLGASQRVVIWDTTIRKATPDETLYIVGHELGHYMLGHMWKGFLFFALMLLIGLYAMFRALHWALGRWSGDWRIYGPEDWACLAVLFALLEAGMFLASPIANGFSRMQEHAADIYGLEVTHGIIPNSSEVAARSFQVLGETDLADPNPSPFITLWLYSHPPLAERLAFAYEYDPWGKGEAPKYVK